MLKRLTEKVWHGNAETDVALYGNAATDLAHGKVVPGLWAKALAQSGGNAERSRSKYIELHVDFQKEEQKENVRRLRAIEAESRRLDRLKDGGERVKAPSAQRRGSEKPPRDASTNDWYEAIAEELEDGRTLKGLWTKCFVECGGDEIQTRVKYIRERVRQFEDAQEKDSQEKLQSEQLKADYGDRQRQRRSAHPEISELDENACLDILVSAGYLSARRINKLSGGPIWHSKSPAGHKIISYSLNHLRYLAVSVRDDDSKILKNDNEPAAKCPSCHGPVQHDTRLCRHCGALFCHRHL